MAAAFRPRGRHVDQHPPYDTGAPTRPAHAVLPAPLHHGDHPPARSAYADARPPAVTRSANAHDIAYPPTQSPPDAPPQPVSPSTQQHHEATSSTAPMQPSPAVPSTQHAPAPPPAPPLLPNTAPSGQFDMLPPPASTHASWQALHEYAQTHAAAHGYALSINTTAKNRSRIKLACVCYGQPKNTHKLTPETRVRKNRLSYKTGCRMWVEGKRVDAGAWVLRVGEPGHNHKGRPSEGWAVQRKRTWGVVGGRIGVGGVTAKEEQARRVSESKAGAGEEEQEEGEANDEDAGPDGAELVSQHPPRASHSLESGGIVWKIVEQEMLRKGSDVNHGRDRGVGRTVDVLQARLPGIRIFKRDVYNIRAQIKRARKAAGQQVGEGLASDHEDGDGEGEGDVDVDVDVGAAAAEDDDDVHVERSPMQTTPLSQPQHHTHHHQQHHHASDRRWSAPNPINTHDPPPPPPHPASTTPTPPQIDPSLTHTHTHAHAQHPVPTPPRRASAHAQWEQREVARLVAENAELRRLLGERTAELKERSIELASLRSQMDYLMLTGR